MDIREFLEELGGLEIRKKFHWYITKDGKIIGSFATFMYDVITAVAKVKLGQVPGSSYFWIAARELGLDENDMRAIMDAAGPLYIEREANIFYADPELRRKFVAILGLEEKKAILWYYKEPMNEINVPPGPPAMASAV